MFINSEKLLSRIKSVSDEIFLKSGGKIMFEEYISLPHYGQIILRFNLLEDGYTVDDLDYYEALLYECVQDEFLVDFMGDVYRNVGIDYRHMDSLFAKCLDFYGQEKTQKSIYAGLIDADAGYLLGLCGLDSSLPVWEIQLEDEVYLLLFGERNEMLGKYNQDGLTINVLSANKKACDGLTKAVFYARRNNISMARALLNVQKTD